MKSNIFRRLLSLTIVLTLLISASAFSLTPFSAAESESDAVSTASNAEPSRNEYQIVSPVPSGSSIVPIEQPSRLSSLNGKKIALVGGSFSASVTHAVISDISFNNG